MSKPYQLFEARASQPDAADEILEGTLLFTGLVMRFESDRGRLEIPLHHLLAELEPGEGRILFTDPHQPGLVITTLDTSVLEVRSVPQLAALSEEWSNRLARREISRRMKLVVGFVAGCGLILWLGMLATGAMVRSIVGKVSPEFERQFGDEILEEMKVEMSFAMDTNEAAQLAVMSTPLLDALPAGRAQWRFHVVTNSTPNAFALPGGHIVIFTGLLRLAERPEEVVGVIAHEVAHVAHQHGFRRQISSVGPLLVFQIFLNGRSGTLGALAGGSALLVHQSFSQEYEKEADDAGWQYLVAANIDPRGMIGMFRKLKDYEMKQRSADLLPKAFRSHPDLEKRIARLEAKWKKLPRKTEFIQLSPAPGAVR